jgi:hypothetical protein
LESGEYLLHQQQPRETQQVFFSFFKTFSGQLLNQQLEHAPRMMKKRDSEVVFVALIFFPGTFLHRGRACISQ